MHEDSNSSRISITGIQQAVTKDQICEEFKEFGEIVDTVLMGDILVGYVLVDFACTKSAVAAVASKHETICFGGTIYVEHCKKVRNLARADFIILIKI